MTRIFLEKIQLSQKIKKMTLYIIIKIKIGNKKMLKNKKNQKNMKFSNLARYLLNIVYKAFNYTEA